MGAWGTGTFENDDAADWVYDLEGADDLDLVRDALEEAVEVSGYIDLREGARALAAAEVVAASAGRPLPDLPEPVSAWLDSRRPAPTDDDRSLARQAVERVTGARSELAELWGEGDKGEPWWAAVADLSSRLQ